MTWSCENDETCGTNKWSKKMHGSYYECRTVFEYKWLRDLWCRMSRLPCIAGGMEEACSREYAMDRNLDNFWHSSATLMATFRWTIQIPRLKFSWFSSYEEGSQSLVHSTCYSLIHNNYTHIQLGVKWQTDRQMDLRTDITKE
jgi:hypothetical protein